MEIFSTTFLAA